MAFESPTDYIAFFGAVIGVSGFIAGLTASQFHSRWERRHQKQHDSEIRSENDRHARLDESTKQQFEQIQKTLRNIESKLDIDMERMNDAISVIMTEGGQIMPEFSATLKVRSPHTYRYYVLHERRAEDVV